MAPGRRKQKSCLNVKLAAADRCMNGKPTSVAVFKWRSFEENHSEQPSLHEQRTHLKHGEKRRKGCCFCYCYGGVDLILGRYLPLRRWQQRKHRI